MAGSLVVAAAFAAPAAAQPVTTVITHGFSTTEKGVWVQAMAEAILARAGGAGSIYRYTEAAPLWTYVPSPFADGSNNAIVLIFNWVPESDAPDAGPNWNYAQAAGDALYASLRDPIFAAAPPPAPPITPPASLINNRFLHFVGHSRGACVISEAIIRLARDGNIPVDHYTGLDPHPVNGTLDAPFNFNWNDPTPRRWSNVTFADVYWRADGGGLNSLDFDGIPIDGAFNTQLSESALNCCGYSLSHSDVHLWLHGTIDTGPGACDGEQCIDATMRGSWWPEGYTQRGWFYSRLGGGSAQRPAVGPATTAPATPFIMGGDFNNASYAGWSFHGGVVGGQIVSDALGQYLKIGAGIGTASLARHNRFFLPNGSSAIKLDSRVLTGANAAGETLRISLTDQGASGSGGATFVVANDPISTLASASWLTNRTFAIPSNVPRGRTYTLSFQIIPAAGAAAALGLDNIDLVVLPPRPGDINSDGCVDVNDLLAVIGAWGVCPAQPQACPADVNHSGGVDVNDLLGVVTNWGCG